VRLRALPLLLVLTGGDYALWDWSIADGHDLVSLLSGLTLLPLAAATLALLAVGVARLLGFALERQAARRRLGSASESAPAGPAGQSRATGDPASAQAAASAPSSRSAESAGRERAAARRMAA
jgi:hypothetical protein